MGIRWGARISPHVLVLVLTLGVASVPFGRAAVAFTYWWWADSYRTVEFVMEEGRPNDGSPYIAGHLVGESEPRNLVAEMHGDSIVVKGAPDQPFVPGGRVAIWHSPDAPNTLIMGIDTNDVAVAALPDRPGLPSFATYLLAGLTILAAGLKGTIAVANRWSRTYGDPSMLRRTFR